MEKLKSVDQVNLRGTLGGLYSWGWATAGAVAFGWWQRSVAAGVFAIVPLLCAVLISDYGYEIALILRIGFKIRKFKWAMPRSARLVVGSRLRWEPQPMVIANG